MERIVSWEEIGGLLSTFDRSLKYYGVPRGGSYLSAMLNPVMTPEEADVIIDDVIESGATRQKYAKYGKPFIGLFDKSKTSDWLIFPWEKPSEQDLEDNVLRLIQYFDNPTREGLIETPRRYVKFLKEFLRKEEVKYTCFDAEQTDQMIVQSNIPFYSLCEHHLAPFFGTGTIAYIPDKKIVGLSKLARTLEYYAANFQNQERITKQVADRLMEELQPKGVAVTLKANHLCMAMRGVKKPDAYTTTTKLLGCFFNVQTCKEEFLSYVNSNK